MMTRRAKRIWAACWLALTGHQMLAPAHAAEPAPASGFDEALALADQRFVAGDLEGALQVLAPVCSGSVRPECAFALGAIQHGLGHCAEALLQYRRYREFAPQGEHRAEVDAALEDVENQCGAAPGAVTSEVSESPSSPSTFSMPGLSLGATPAAAADPLAGIGVRAAEPAPPSLNRALVFGSFALSGGAAASSLIFGILAAHSASRCDRHQIYDQTFIEQCEHQGPRYQGLWQGFAVASAGFLGVGLSLWWFDPSSSAAIGVAAGGLPTVQLQHSF